MKNTKRILAVLTLMALLVCCVLLSVSANEPKKTFNAEGISNIEDILEYYSAEDFVADNYESEGPDSEYYSGDKSEVVSDPVNEDNKVLKVTGENNAYKVKADTDTLVVSFNIYYDASMVGEYRLNIKTLDANGEESITYTTLFSVNAGAGKFQYSVWDSELNNGEGGFVSADFENAAAAADTWYKVVVFFNASEGNYSFKILYNDKSGKTVQAESEKISLGNVSSATDIVLKSAVKQRGEKVFMYLDNVRLYTGTFERSSANKGYVTTRTFLDLEALYNAEETDLQTQVRIARVFEELCLSGKYTPVLEAYEDLGISPDDVVSIKNNISKYVNAAFANEIIRMAKAIDLESGYAARVENVKEYDYYNAILLEYESLTDAPGIDAEVAEALTEARTTIEDEKSLCEEIAKDSEKLLKLMLDYDAENADYDGYLTPLYEAVLNCAKWDLTYTGFIGESDPFTVQDAANILETFLDKYNRINSVANAFIESANQMKAALVILRDAEQKMNNAYTLYTSAEQKMNAALAIMNGINIEDANLPEEDRALYDEQKLIYEAEKAIYDDNVAVYEAENAIYEEEFANLANGYLAAREVYNGGDIDASLDEATHSELFSLFSIYTDNEEFVLIETALSDRFIEIVKAAEIATYYTSRVERLKEAEGYLDSIRIKYGTVAAALEKYNELKNAIALQEKAAADYIAAVNEIAKAETFEQRKTLVEAATALKAEGDVLGISGVNEANMALSEAAARIETESANSVTLIALTSEIGSVRDFMARRELIAKAQYAADNTDDTIEGVTEAKALLSEFLDAYVAEVNKMNATHAATSEKAADLIGSAVSDENVYKAASVIKDFVN